MKFLQEKEAMNNSIKDLFQTQIMTKKCRHIVWDLIVCGG